MKTESKKLTKKAYGDPNSNPSQLAFLFPLQRRVVLHLSPLLLHKQPHPHSLLEICEFVQVCDDGTKSSSSPVV